MRARGIIVKYPYEPPLMGYDLFKLKIVLGKTNKLPWLCTHFFHFQASTGLIQMEDVQKTLFRQSASSLKEDKHVFIQSNSRLTIYDPIFFAFRSSLFRVILKSVKQYMTIGKKNTLKLEHCVLVYYLFHCLRKITLNGLSYYLKAWIKQQYFPLSWIGR